MKKATILIIIALLAGNAWAQKNFSRTDIFSTHEVTWFGLDFSAIRCIDPTGFTNPDAIVSTSFKSMNDIFLNEAEKYDLKKFLGKRSVPFDLDPVTQLNAAINPSELVLPAGSSYSIAEGDLGGMVSRYQAKSTEGIGLVFIMETFDKPSETATIWVTFFDIASGKVLLSEKLREKAGGFGFRNYWVKTAYNALDEIQKKKMKAWQKQ